MSDESLGIDELRQVLELMARHGVTQIDYRGLKLARVPEKQVASTPDAQREFDRLAAMSSDKVDAALLKSRFGGA